jgi:hypothetical protein
LIADAMIPPLPIAPPVPMLSVPLPRSVTVPRPWSATAMVLSTRMMPPLLRLIVPELNLPTRRASATPETPALIHREPAPSTFTVPVPLLPTMVFVP